MAMNPRTHPRGAPPDFSMAGLPPKPSHTTDALWWLVQMRLRLEPKSENGGTFANKAGSHNTGNNLLNKKDSNGNHIWKNDHSIRHEWNRTGPWWREFSAATDWTFDGAHTGDYTEINLYTHRMLKAMRDPKDLRPDQVMFYCIGQEDDDSTVEGWHELRDEVITGDKSHLWHRHDSLFRNIVGSFWAMWKILTIDMGWTYAEWLRSTQTPPKEWDEVATKAEVQAAAEAGARAALTEVIEYTGSETSGPQGRIHAAGWGDTSPMGRLDYLVELVMAKKTAEGESGSLMARVERLEEGMATLLERTTPPV